MEQAFRYPELNSGKHVIKVNYSKRLTFLDMKELRSGTELEAVQIASTVECSTSISVGLGTY